MGALDLLDWRKWVRVFGKERAYYGEALSWSNRTVSEWQALNLTTAWACVALTSQACGTIPAQVFRNRDDGTAEEDRKHPLYRMIRRKPNSQFTATRFWQSTFAALDLWGNAYYQKQRLNRGDQVAALDWLAPEHMNCEPEGGRPVYRFSDPNTRVRRIIPIDDIVHVRGFNTGGFMGLSPTKYGQFALSSATNVEEATSRFFANAMRPSGFFETPQGRVLTDDQRRDFKEKFLREFAGLENAGAVGLLEGGFKWNSVTMNPDDAQMLMSRRMSVEEICRLYRTPPIMIGHASEGQTMWGSGVEQVILQWLTTRVGPMIINLEEQLNADVLTPADDAAGVSIRFNLSALLRSTAEAQANVLRSLVQGGIMTPNEARAKLNLRKVDGGDELLVQQQMIPISDAGQTSTETPPAILQPQNDNQNRRRQVAR